MTGLRRLAEALEARFDDHLRAIDPDVPRHAVEFSGRITESWALIYYRRHLVRLSPYLFLLDSDELKHGTHWRELDATLRHEAAHAAVFHLFGETGHSPRFHAALAQLGVLANGTCDLGPENVAYRYVYACPTCDTTWPRRAKLRGNWSCGSCGPGRFVPEHRLTLREERDLASRLRARRMSIEATLAEAQAALQTVPLVSFSRATPRGAPRPRSTPMTPRPRAVPMAPRLRVR